VRSRLGPDLHNYIRSLHRIVLHLLVQYLYENLYDTHIRVSRSRQTDKLPSMWPYYNLHCSLFVADRIWLLAHPHVLCGRVERWRDGFRPRASCMSALSSNIANQHPVLPFVPSPAHTLQPLVGCCSIIAFESTLSLMIVASIKTDEHLHQPHQFLIPKPSIQLPLAFQQLLLRSAALVP
jgi:hypothetical protein